MPNRKLLQRKPIPWSWRHPLQWFGQQWNRARQNVDLVTLWPACKEEAARRYPPGETAIEKARLVFIGHMGSDSAWKDEFQSEEELGDFVRSYLV